ncbi:MAG: hypothetical protein IT454_10470 [Planctomycetes bacterium]|nr:hypothetical protein [Planctomycetota bacterium]
MKSLAPLALVAAVSSCVSPPQSRRAVFIESEYVPYAETGTGRIEGQAFIKTRGGDVKYCAGNTVWLNPVTTYSTEWYSRGVVGGENLESADPRVNPYRRETVGDGEGRFVFENLPAGEYFIACTIRWEVPLGKYGTQWTGGNAHTRVTVRENETARVIATR